MSRHTYVVRLQLPSGGRYSVDRQARSAAAARASVQDHIERGASVVRVSRKPY